MPEAGGSSGVTVTDGLTSLPAVSQIVIPHGGLTNLGGGMAGVQAVVWNKTVLTDAQIKAIPTTAVQLLAAPGALRLITVVTVIVGPLTGAGVYTNVDQFENGFQIQFGDGSGVEFPCHAHAYMADVQPGNAVTLGTEAQYIGTQTSASNTVVDLGLYVSLDNNGAGNFTGGNAANRLPITVYFSVVDVSTS